jgi:hypothetical protein
MDGYSTGYEVHIDLISFVLAVLFGIHLFTYLSRSTVREATCLRLTKVIEDYNVPFVWTRSVLVPVQIDGIFQSTVASRALEVFASERIRGGSSLCSRPISIP